MKTCVILIALATLLPLAGCVAPYPHYRYGYDHRYYGGAYGDSDRYGYNDGGSYYSYGGRGDPYAYYSAPRGYGYHYYGYDD